MTMHRKSLSTTTVPKTVQNESKLIELVKGIKLTRAILKFYEKFIHPFSYLFIFSNMFPESHGFVFMPVTSSSNGPIFHYIVSEGRQNCSTL